MALGSGTLILNSGTSSEDIHLEVEGTTVGTYALTTASNNADPTVGTLPTGMRDFVNHSQSTTPTAPTKCTTAMNGPLFGIQCTWFDTSDNETGFKIQWSVNGGAYGSEQTVGAGVTVAYKGGCTDGDTYKGRVLAYNGAGDSAWCTSPFVATGDSDCTL